jgi:hypothetical protein
MNLFGFAANTKTILSGQIHRLKNNLCRRLKLHVAILDKLIHSLSLYILTELINPFGKQAKGIWTPRTVARCFILKFYFRKRICTNYLSQ